MKRLLLLLLIATPIMANDLVDPMEPPSYAKWKFNQAKNKGLKAEKPVVAKKQEVGLSLQSVLVSNQRKVAIINQKAMSVGDTIEGAKLIKINSDSVALVKKGKLINLGVNSQPGLLKITRRNQ